MANKKIGMILAGVSLMAVVTAQAGGAPIPQATSSIKITNMGVRGSLIKYDDYTLGYYPATEKDDLTHDVSAFMDFGAKSHGVGANVKLDYDNEFSAWNEPDSWNKEVSLFTKVGNAKVMLGKWRPDGIMGGDRNPSRNDWMWQNESYFVTHARSSDYREGAAVSMGVGSFDVEAQVAQDQLDENDIYGIGIRTHFGKFGFNAGYTHYDGAGDDSAAHVAVKFGTHGVGLMAAYEQDESAAGDFKYMGVSAVTKFQGFGLRAGYQRSETPADVKNSQMSLTLAKEIQRNVKAELGYMQDDKDGDKTSHYGLALSANF